MKIIAQKFILMLVCCLPLVAFSQTTKPQSTGGGNNGAATQPTGTTKPGVTSGGNSGQTTTSGGGTKTAGTPVTGSGGNTAAPGNPKMLVTEEKISDQHGVLVKSSGAGSYTIYSLGDDGQWSTTATGILEAGGQFKLCDKGTKLKVVTSSCSGCAVVSFGSEFCN